MVLSELKDLERLFKLCRKQGISEMEIQGIKFKLGEVPNVPRGTVSEVEAGTDNPYADFPDGELTPEQLMFYSSGGRPEEDPFRKDKAL